MNRASKTGLQVACVVVPALALLALWSSGGPVAAHAEDAGKAGSGPHYTVVMTEGHNLLVTDNATNRLYFYTIDKDAKIGAPLKLRASVDLTKVGQEEIKIAAHNLEKVEK
jgi:hypothetical protein